MNHPSKKSNRLINEKSPYLIQHAFNPVDWYPWSDEAFEKARKEDKPIFLSVGYSTCHWCHVMEKESFENEEIARMMNDVFVSIKVDREERPEIDNIYMLTCQMINGNGGWPLSIIMTHDKKPFFAGTYFPPENRYGKIGFKDLIANIESAWKTKRQEIYESVDQISNYLSQMQSSSSKVNLGIEVLNSAFIQYEKRFDNIYGGFGTQPKFPSPHNLMFLLRYWKRTGETNALKMVTKTLTEMRKGGIFDHIGFGFHRYSTDTSWLIPHFEKMLYDQAMLIISYTEAYLATGNAGFKQTAEEIIEYVIRDMTSPLGGFYSAEDADSEGHEGKYYLWSQNELQEILKPGDAEFATSVFNIRSDGNFNDGSSGMSTGNNILHTSKTNAELAQSFGLREKDFNNKLSEIRSLLFERRNKRVHPFKDDKVLCDWNGLMIAALSIAGRAFSNVDYITAAEKAASFITSYLTDKEGKLIHRFRDGVSGITANIDDYAFLTWGLIELYQSTFKKKYIDEAERLTQLTIKHFWDKAAGGFFFTPDYAEQVLVRTKEIYDGAIPSGNSVMLLNLIRLNRLTSEMQFNEFVSSLIDAFSANISKAPAASAFFLLSLEYLYGESNEIIIVGKSYDEELQNFVSVLRNQFMPSSTIIFLNDFEPLSNPSYDYLKAYSLINNKSTIYLCKNFSCDVPTNDLKDVMHRLGIISK